MKKFLIISTIFAVLVLGLVAQQFHVGNEQEVPGIATVQNVQPKLTRSQKLEQQYEPSSDPIGEIPVIFERIATSEIEQKPKDKSVVLTVQAPIAEARVASSSNDSLSTLAHQVSHHTAPVYSGYEPEPQFEMDGYPYAQYPHVSSKSAPSASVSSCAPGQSVQNQNLVTHDDQEELEQSKRFKAPRSSLSGTYRPTLVHDPVKVSSDLEQKQNITIPQEEVDQLVAKSSLLGRLKNGLSKIPKWLCGLPLVAGAYALLKKAPEVVDGQPSESEKIDIAGNVHDKLQELQDEYLKNQTPQDPQPKSSPEIPVVLEEQSVVQSPASMEQSLTQPTGVQSELTSTPFVAENNNTIAPVSGGSFAATRTLLSPVRSLDQMSEGTVPELMEAPVTTAVVPTTSVVTALETPASQPGIVQKTLHNCYHYFARRLSSPVGVLALATKAAGIGLQVAPAAYAAHQAHVAHQESLMLDSVVAQVMSTIKPIDTAQYMPSMVSVDGTQPSYMTQIASGNGAAVAQQLATQCSTLRLR